MISILLPLLLLGDVGITNSATGARVLDGKLLTTTMVDGGIGASTVNGYHGNAADVTEGSQLNTSSTNPLWDDTFNATAQNTGKYRAPVATQTVTYSGGFVNLNGSAVTSINTNSAYQTYRVFPLIGRGELRLNVSAIITQVPQVNAVTELGLFTASLPGAAAPTDGCLFRWNAAAEFRGVCSYNGSEVQTPAITSPSVNVNHDYTIVLQTNAAIFLIDDVQVGKLTMLVDAPGVGQPLMQGTAPFTARYYIAGSAPALASQLKISDVFITQRGYFPNRDWGEAKAGFGHMAYQGQNGGTMGSTALYTNGLACGAGVAATNTTAALGSGLGGQFAVQPTLVVPTDGIISSFQNPAGSVTQTPRNLIVKGVWIDGIVSTAFTGGPVYYIWSLAFGHTGVSLVTAEGALTKAARRIPLGIQTYVVTAPVGTLGQRIYVPFTKPIVVAPGEFVQTVAKNVGTVTSAGVICMTVGFDAVFE